MSFKELLLEAQFHGSNRLAERRFRYIWGIVLAILLWAAGCIVAITISRFIENHAFIAITESENVQLKFPSVIMCPEIEFPDYKMDVFVKELDYPPNTNATYIRSVLLQLGAFFSPDVPYVLEDLKMLQSVLEYNMLDVEAVGKKLTQSCEESILKCRWITKLKNCSELFRMELTDIGFCCVFNGRSIRREITEFGIHNAEPPEEILTEETSFTSSLSFVVNSSQTQSDVDLTYKWIAAVRGLQYVESGVNGTPITPNTEHWVLYGSRRFNIDHVTSTLSPGLRRCRMSNEKLKYFPNYTKRYCLLECQMLRTIQRCQCVRFAHPRPPTVSYCRASDLLCASKAAVPYATNECDCPLTCDSDIANYATYSTPLDSGYYNDNLYDNLNFSSVSVIRVHVRHWETKQFTRRSYFTSYDLFAQIGGVFNVFFGCSILTILELVQLAWRIIKGRMKAKSVPEVKKKRNNKRMKISVKKPFVK